MRLLLPFALAAGISVPCLAQSDTADSRGVLLKGYDMYEKQEYKRAIEIFKQVHECDSNYVYAVYETVLSLIADSQFTEAKKLALSSVNLRNAPKRDMLLQLASCYDYCNQPDSAIFLYDSLSRMYPHDHQPVFEKGVVYYQQKKYDQAAELFQRALILNPNHFRSHYMLGKTYAMQGRLSEAIMATTISLLQTKQAEQARLAIVTMAAITEQKDEIKKAYETRNEKYSNPAYDEIDQVINAKLALSSSYKLKMSINDNVFRQTQALMEKLKFDPSDTSFAMQYYVPIFTEIYKQDMFEGFMLLAYSEFGLQSVDAAAKRQKGAIEEVRQVVFPALAKIGATRVLNYTARQKAPERYHQLSESNLFFIGSLNDKGNLITGDAVFYRTDQSLYCTGRYTTDGNKTGNWKYYYKQGGISKDVTFRNDTAIGEMKEYYGNGNLKKVTTYDNNGDATREDEYTYAGSRSYSTIKKGDNETEEAVYYKSGNIQIKAGFVKKKMKDGDYKFYHDNGQVEKAVSFKNGNYTGTFKKYYDDGTIAEESTLEDGKTEGVETVYYDNGKISRRANYHNGLYDGLCETFRKDGTPLETIMFKKGKRSGMNKRFNPAGKVYAELEMDDDVPQSLKFWDEAGKEVYAKEGKRGLLEYQIYFYNGTKASDIKINSEGQFDGHIVYYYFTGAKSSEMDYENGKRQGKYTSYYKNGNKKTEDYYKDEELDGPSKTYYENGVLMMEGWYKDGKKLGTWKNYYRNGKQENEYYYVADDLCGNAIDYNLNGEPELKYIYDFDVLTDFVAYDAYGKKTDSLVFPGGHGDYITTLKGSSLKMREGKVQYGSLHGPLIFRYPSGQVSREMTFTFGRREGAFNSFYPNGVPETKMLFRAGNKTGEHKFYNEVGELVTEENYHNGSVEGVRKSYACNRLYIEYNYQDGEKHGMQKYLGDDGHIACVLYYDDGDVVGYSHEGKDGKLLPMIPVKNGTAHIVATYADGRKSADFNIVQSEFEGTCKVYYMNGNVAEERNSKNGMLDGAFRRYLPDGKLIYENTYKDDMDNGFEKAYDKNGVLLVSKECYYGQANGTVAVTDPATRKTVKYIYRYGELVNVTE